MLSSGVLHASRGTACCLYSACGSVTTTLLGSVINSTEKNARSSNSTWTGGGLVCQRNITALAARRVSETPTSVVKPVQKNYILSTSKNSLLGISSESRFENGFRNLRYYHITPYAYRKVEFVAGDRLRKPKIKPILKHDVIILIDEGGNNLGKMDSKMALGMAEGQGLEVELVASQKKTVNGIEECTAVFKMASKGTLPEGISNKKNLRKSSVEVIKEVHFGTKITEHDILNKLRHVVDLLERGKSVRVYSEVRAKGKWMSSEIYEEELKKRETIIDDLEERLKGLGIREKELKAKGKMIYVHFKPSPEVLRKRAETLKERAESLVMMKKMRWQKKEERAREKEGEIENKADEN